MARRIRVAVEGNLLWNAFTKWCIHEMTSYKSKSTNRSAFHTHAHTHSHFGAAAARISQHGGQRGIGRNKLLHKLRCKFCCSVGSRANKFDTTFFLFMFSNALVVARLLCPGSRLCRSIAAVGGAVGVSCSFNHCVLNPKAPMSLTLVKWNKPPRASFCVMEPP